jgi:predicted ATP-grasp superfamily ATP-dependent carboligase
VILANPGWFGTLAAVRDLGRRGIDVRVAARTTLEPSCWSQYGHRVSAPSDSRRYVEWLLAGGPDADGAVVCPTSDDLAFLFALHGDKLRARYRLPTASVAVLRELLDKGRLHRHAAAGGLRAPATAFPSSVAEAESMAAGASWPQLLKLRTQVLSRTLHKGTPLRSIGELRAEWERFRQRNRFGPEVLEAWPEIAFPMLQEYLPHASEHIYCLAGFINARGDRWATRAATKVLSHPRYLGIGLLFEHAPVDPALEAKVLQLCRSVGFHGLFQCEFLEHQGERLLIDFNPRFYNYMAFDHARGLPQAYLCYLQALGALDEVDRELERARAEPPEAAGTVFCYRTGTRIQLGLERLFGRIPPEEPGRWQRWLDRADRIVDPVWTDDDPRPATIDLLLRVGSMGRHPRAFLRHNTRRAL